MKAFHSYFWLFFTETIILSMFFSRKPKVSTKTTEKTFSYENPSTFSYIYDNGKTTDTINELRDPFISEKATHIIWYLHISLSLITPVKMRVNQI